MMMKQRNNLVLRGGWQGQILIRSKASHPNKLPFTGILTRIDMPSDKPPQGADGHCVSIRRHAALEALPTLLGMGVDVSSGFEEHNAQKKVGVMTSANIEGNAVLVGGHLYARDFPSEVQEIRDKAQAGLMGMSYEIADVEVEDTDAAVWQIDHLIFTGAAILYRDAAAYQSTQLMAAMDKELTLTAKKKQISDLMEELGTITASLSPDDVKADDGEKSKDDTEVMSGDMSKLLSTMMTQMKTMADDIKTMRTAMSDHSASGESGKDGDDVLGRLAAMVKGESPNPEVHDDEEQDIALFKQLMDKMKKGGMKPTDAAKETPPADVEASRIASVEAQLGLVTDALVRMSGLLTDKTSSNRALATDKMESPEQGGPTFIPPRRTVAAQTNEPSYLGKYGMEELEANKKYTVSEIDTMLTNAGVADPAQRMAIKHNLQGSGALAV